MSHPIEWFTFNHIVSIIWRLISSNSLVHSPIVGYRKIALNVKVSSIVNIPQPPNVPTNISEDRKFEIYTRLTVKIDDSLQMHKLMKSDAQMKYDLLSIEIGNNEKLLNQFCGGHLNCDILSLELTNPKICFPLRKANLNLPREKGIMFEICYRDLLSSQSIRINTISNARLLVEKCKGKNVLFSSGAKYKLDFRSPVDVSNLGELFGMKPNLSKEAVFWNAIRALKHSSKWLVNELDLIARTSVVLWSCCQVHCTKNLNWSKFHSCFTCQFRNT